MKKRQIKKTVKEISPKRDMSVSELSKVMLKGFKDSDQKHEDLAGMVARGFNEVHVDMRSMEEHLGGRIDTLEHKVDRVQDSVNELSYESRKMKTRVDNLELKVFGSIQET